MNKSTSKSRKLWMIYTYFILFMMGFCLGLVSMYFGASYYFMPMFLSYFNDVYLVILNIFPVIHIIFLLYFLTNRVWISFLVTSIVTISLTWANYWKLLIRNDPLLVMDIPLFFESIDMLGEFDINLNWKMEAVLIACVLGTIFSFFFVKAKVHSLRVRLLGAIVLVLIGIYSFNNIYMDSKIYSSRENYDLINRWSFTQVYISNGFIYPFIHSIKSCFHKPPEGYDEKEAKERMLTYQYSHIPDEIKVNVISIMLEAYNDFSKFDKIEFKKDVYESYRQIKEESYSGELVTNIFAGGTVNTEWSFITGFTSIYNFRTNVNSYAHYFKEQGFTVEGSHPGYDWFYNRKNINEYLEFENYYFYENYYAELADNKIADDSILFPEIINLYNENKKSGKPYFSFNVTYQNHGPYSSEKLTDEQYVVNNNGLNEEEYNILNNYFSGIYSTNVEMKKLVDYFKEEEEPVVVIFFGDHNPWLGDNNSVYKTLGINLDFDTEEGFYNYYNTPYIIWANNSAKEILNNDFVGEGPTIGPYFLMNEFFYLAGYAGNEFMKVSNELRENIDVLHLNKLYKESDKLTTELTPISNEKLNIYIKLEYFWKKNFSN